MENKQLNTKRNDPIRNGDVVEQFGNEYTVDNIDELEELLNLWENVVYEGKFEELYSLVDELYSLQEDLEEVN